MFDSADQAGWPSSTFLSDPSTCSTLLEDGLRRLIWWTVRPHGLNSGHRHVLCGLHSVSWKAELAVNIKQKQNHRNGYFTQECKFPASLESPENLATLDSRGVRQQWTGQVLSSSLLYCLSNSDLSASYSLLLYSCCYFLQWSLEESEVFPVKVKCFQYLCYNQSRKTKYRHAFEEKCKHISLLKWKKDSHILICK